MGFCGAASAQVAGRIGVQSDYIVRGASFTHNRPVASLDLSYDNPSGVYLNGQAYGALPADGRVGVLGLVGDLGYARRLNRVLSVDGGVTRTEYMGVGENSYSVGYTEFYAGVSTRRLSARLYYSPDYYRPGEHTLYAELAGNVRLVEKVRLNAHVGSVIYLASPANLELGRTQVDWLIGLSRQFGPVDLHAAVSGGGPAQYYAQPRPETRLVVGAGYTF